MARKANQNRSDDAATERLDASCSRRDFLSAIGCLALGGVSIAESPSRDRATLGSAPAQPGREGVLLGQAAKSPSHALGIQLYTVRDPLARDFEGTLAQLARIGYKEVEFAGLHGHPAKDVRAMLDRLGLKAPGGHYGLPDIQDTLDQTVIEAKVLGFEYVIVPWLPEEFRTRDGFARVAELFYKAGEKLRAAGLRLGYHNHDFEFAELQGGGIGYDVLLEKTEPKLVWLELDLFWIRKGGRNELDYFRRYPNRYRLVHIKDMAADGTMVDIGKGAMNWTELLGAARKAGVQHFLTEHDGASDSLGFAKRSFEYLSRLQF